MKIIKCCIGCDCENCEEYKKQMKTLECLKMWIYFHPYLFSAIIIIIFSVVFIFCVLNFTPTYFAEATITDIGYKGLTVTYKDEYGGEVLQAINIDDPSEYRVGEIITIQIWDGGGIKGIVANEHT